MKKKLIKAFSDPVLLLVWMVIAVFSTLFSVTIILAIFK